MYDNKIVNCNLKQKKKEAEEEEDKLIKGKYVNITVNTQIAWCSVKNVLQHHTFKNLCFSFCEVIVYIY